MINTRYRIMTCLLVMGLIFITAGPLPAEDAFQPEPSAREFIEKTGDNRRTFFWSLQETEGWLLTSKGDGREVHKTHLDRNLHTERWSLEQPADDTSIAAWRDGEVLQVQGTFKGRDYQATHRVGSTPWYQALSLSLRRHLADFSGDQDFWTLRPDNLDLHRLEIAAVTATSLQAGDSKVSAYRVEIRPAGWKSAFWKGDYWFSRENREFIRYQGASGPPGWPATTIEPAHWDTD